MSVRQADNPELFENVQEKNLLRQYDLLLNCIEIGLEKGIEAFDKYTLWSPNAAAVANIAQFGGRYRQEPIYVGNHIPPHFRDVPDQMDRFFPVIHENWNAMDHPTLLPAYALWRMNWIHPFVEGNGRTARAACYYLICLRQGRILPGTKLVPERIRENRQPYYEALRAADLAWEEGHFDVSQLTAYLNDLLKAQLTDIGLLSRTCSKTSYAPGSARSGWRPKQLKMRKCASRFSWYRFRPVGIPDSVPTSGAPYMTKSCAGSGSYFPMIHRRCPRCEGSRSARRPTHDDGAHEWGTHSVVVGTNRKTRKRVPRT